MIWDGPILPLIALACPLLLASSAALPAMRSHVMRLLPVMPLPALWLAWTGSEGSSHAPWFLLGATLGLDPARQLLLGMTALLWVIAGIAAAPLAKRQHAGLFAGFWGLTLAGNLGVFLARDVASFYVAFAAVSLAAWVLVVHDRTETALRAGRVYLLLAVFGEVCLLAGLLIGTEAAGSLDIAAVRGALAQAPLGGVAVGLLVAGFGIKAGLVPLHVWLPLAHPSAPVPASAVLSGAIVKAGLIGWMLFLPQGVAAPVLIALGLAGAYGAALWGLTQRNPKTVLAYSTISQMGLMAVLVGVGGAAKAAAPYFALHHGLAKGALFLLAGAMLAASPRLRVAGLVIAAALGASVAGAPLTGGALAKAALKPALPGALGLALSLSSVTTALLLSWYLRCLAATAPKAVGGGAGQLVSAAVLGLLATGLMWRLWPVWGGSDWTDLMTAKSLLSAIWPLAVAAPLVIVIVRLPAPAWPAGDLLLLFRGVRLDAPFSVRWPWQPRALDGFGRPAARAILRAEAGMLPWPVGGALLTAFALVMALLLILG